MNSAKVKVICQCGRYSLKYPWDWYAFSLLLPLVITVLVVQILLHAALKYDGLNYLEIVEIRWNFNNY